MTTRTFAQVQRYVMAQCHDGKRRSELNKIHQKVADVLINQGRLIAIPLPDGDWHLEPK